MVSQQLSALIYICKFTHHSIVQYVVDRMVFRWGYSHLRTFKFIFRAKMRKWEVANVKKQKRRRYKGESEVAKGSSFFYYHSFAFAPSPSRRRNFSLSPSQLRTSAFAFFCMYTCSTLSFKHNVDCKSGVCGRGRTLRKVSYDEIQILLC